MRATILNRSRTLAGLAYTRGSSSAWTQQAKLVATDAIGAQQGYSVSLSGDGATAIVGGYRDNKSLSSQAMAVDRSEVRSCIGAR